MEHKEITFDILVTELFTTYKESTETFLEMMSTTQDPMELIALLADYNEFVGTLNAEVIGAIVASSTTYFAEGDIH